MNFSTAAMSDDGASTATIDGDSSRSAISDPARLRLCPSSPICSIWARIALTSIGSLPASIEPRTAFDRIGPSTSRIQASRVRTSSLKAPIRSTLPRPSLRLQNASPPLTGSLRHHIHIDGLVDAGHRADRAVVVARVERDLAGGQDPLGVLDVGGPALEQAGADRARRASGPTRSPRSAAARSAAASGRRRPMTSRAGRTSTSCEPAARIRSTATRFAACRRGIEGEVGDVGGVAEARRPPVDVVHLGALGAQRVGEDVDARGDDGRRRGEQSTEGHEEAPSRSRAYRVAAALEAKTAAPAAASASAWRRPALRIALGADERDHHGQVLPRAGGGQRGHERARRVGVRPVAEDDVHQQDGGLVRAASAASASSRSVGSIIGCARPTVRASSPKSMTT